MSGVLNCGILTDAPPEMLVSVVRDMLLHEGAITTMAEKGMALIDGKGLERVAKHILAL
jgi:hypothetical protein